MAKRRLMTACSRREPSSNVGPIGKPRPSNGDGDAGGKPELSKGDGGEPRLSDGDDRVDGKPELSCGND